MSNTTDPQSMIDGYFECWNATDEATRRDAISRIWVPDARPSDPVADVTGHDQLATHMSTFSERTTINAPRHTVWATLADIGTIATWNPGLIGSHRTNDLDGLGGARHCDISARHSLVEHVVKFEPTTAITFRITDTTLPFKTADIAFTLTDVQHHAGTEVSVSPTYTLRYGPIGRILDIVAVRRTYRAGMRELLEGLRHHVEQLC